MTAPESASGEMQSSSIVIHNNTITRNHGLYCNLQIEKVPDGRLSTEIRIKDPTERSRMGWLIQSKNKVPLQRERAWANMHKEEEDKRRKDADRIEQNRQMVTGYHEQLNSHTKAMQLEEVLDLRP